MTDTPQLPVLPQVPHGAWPSPISAADLAADAGRPSWPAFVDGALWWSETRPAEAGRTAIVRAETPGPAGVLGPTRELLPAPWSARTRVHEYGGRSWLVLRGPLGPVLVFAEDSDQRLYAMEPPAPGPTGASDAASDAGSGGSSSSSGTVPRPITPKPEAGHELRYADPVAGPGGDRVVCVRESHSPAGIRRHLVEVRLTGEVRELVGGSDFLAFPRPSPDGRHLAWIAWDHPAMPWTSTVLRVGDVLPDGSVAGVRDVLGGPGVSVLQPEWGPDGTLYAATDESGFWNLVSLGAGGRRPARPLCPRAEEFAGPLWELGYRWYAVLADGRLACLHGTDTTTLSTLDPLTGQLAAVGDPAGASEVGSPTVGSGAGGLTAWDASLTADGGLLAGVAGSASSRWGLTVVDVDTGATVRRPAAGLAPDPAVLPQPYAVELPSVGGRVVHANVYPPRNPAVVAPPGELAPYVVVVHGGPTGQSPMVADVSVAYWTSRGLGVLDVNYGGSSGYGRAYRDVLDEQWGIVDVEDVAAAARALADRGVADGSRLVIRGGSAGGWTVLSALTRTTTFAAGASYYGVAELERFAADTHDFESRYLDHLIGTLPEHRDRYVERAPLSNIAGLSCPVLLLQGADDKIVPPSQAEMFRDGLAARAIPHAYLLFEGEAHGFRRAATVIASAEAELSFYGQVLGFVPPGVPVLPLTPSVGASPA